MTRLVDFLSIVLLVCAAVGFYFGLSALRNAQDLGALYWLCVGASCLWASTNLLRPAASP